MQQLMDICSDADRVMESAVRLVGERITIVKAVVCNGIRGSAAG